MRALYAWFGLVCAGCAIDGVVVGYRAPELRAEGEGVFDEVEVGCQPEDEPNGSPDDQEYEWLGLVDGERAPRLCGHLSSTGVDGYGYFAGDFDYAYFQTLQSRTIALDFQWEEASDLSLFFLPQDAEAYVEVGDGVEVRVPVGFHLLVVVGASGPATDYTLTIEP